MCQETWFEEFAGKAAPKLRDLFEHDLGVLPPELAALMVRLKESEDQPQAVT